jgi:hypothetical protein
MDALAVSAATQLDSCHEQKPITGGERVRRQMSGKATYQEFEARELQNLSSAFFFPPHSNEANPGVPSLFPDPGVKKCPASLCPKAAARSG